MRDSLLRRYHRLSPPLRSAVATVRGSYLRFWRYGGRTADLRDAALEREVWSTSRWQQWRDDRLGYVLNRAATRVPYYRDHWARRRRLGDRGSWEYLENWPILEKEALRGNPKSFLADDCAPKRMFHDHTSGTSGKSLDLWLSRATVQSWYSIFEARCRVWNGVSRHDRWGIFGGQLVAPVEQDEPPFWVWNAALHQLYLSSYHLSPRTAPNYVNALRTNRVRYVLGYPSAIHALAKAILNQNLQPPAIEFILTNAEPVTEQQRLEMEEAFQCPVRETYGMAEIVAGASECSLGRLHLWPEIGDIQILGEGHSAGHPAVGEFVCTGLLNADMPLIRYRVGDRGTLSPPDTRCGCGRTLPILLSVEGRVDDVLYTVDGRRIGRLDPIFKSRIPISEAQIVQEALDLIRIRFVPDRDFTAADRHSLIERVRERMGPVRVVLEEVDSIQRGGNGKFRSVICNLSSDDRKRVGAL